MTVLGQIVNFINSDKTKALHVEIKEWGGKRSDEQNKALWGVAYETILSQGMREKGWDKDDLHEFFLGEFHGWEAVQGFGKAQMRPIKRSSKLSMKDFAEFYSFVQRKAAEFGIDVPDPDPKWRENV